MHVTVSHGADGVVRVTVEDSVGSAMESGEGVQVPDDGLIVAQGQSVELEITDVKGSEPDLDSVQVRD